MKIRKNQADGGGKQDSACSFSRPSANSKGKAVATDRLRSTTLNRTQTRHNTIEKTFDRLIKNEVLSDRFNVRCTPFGLDSSRNEDGLRDSSRLQGKNISKVEKDVSYRENRQTPNFYKKLAGNVALLHARQPAEKIHTSEQVNTNLYHNFRLQKQSCSASKRIPSSLKGTNYLDSSENNDFRPHQAKPAINFQASKKLENGQTQKRSRSNIPACMQNSSANGTQQNPEIRFKCLNTHDPISESTRICGRGLGDSKTLIKQSQIHLAHIETPKFSNQQIHRRPNLKDPQEIVSLSDLSRKPTLASHGQRTTKANTYKKCTTIEALPLDTAKNSNKGVNISSSTKSSSTNINAIIFKKFFSHHVK
jgi:hypothetical protein